MSQSERRWGTAELANCQLDPSWGLITDLNETRVTAGEVAGADETMVIATALTDGRTPRAHRRQRAPPIRRRQQRAVVQERLHMAAWRSSLGDGFSSNFDGYGKIVWRSVMRNRAAADHDQSTCFQGFGKGYGGLGLLFIDGHDKQASSHGVLARA